MSIHFLFILQMYFHKNISLYKKLFDFFVFLIYEHFSQRLFPTTVTQQAAQVQSFS